MMVFARPMATARMNKNYVEEEDFQRFCESIGQTLKDPVHARLMEDGALDFFSLDEWDDVELPRA